MSSWDLFLPGGRLAITRYTPATLDDDVVFGFDVRYSDGRLGISGCVRRAGIDVSWLRGV